MQHRIRTSFATVTLFARMVMVSFVGVSSTDVGKRGSPSTRAQGPMRQSAAMIEFVTIAFFYRPLAQLQKEENERTSMATLSRMMLCFTLTPGPITTPGPMLTPGPIFALGST